MPVHILEEEICEFMALRLSIIFIFSYFNLVVLVRIGASPTVDIMNIQNHSWQASPYSIVIVMGISSLPVVTNHE